MNDQEKRKGNPARVLLALLLDILLTPLGVFATVIPAAKYLHAGHGVSGAIAVGVILVIPLVIWACLYFGLSPERRLGRGVKYLVILLATSILVFGGLAGLGYLASQHNRAQAERNRAQAEQQMLIETGKAVEIAVREDGGVSDLHTGGTDATAEVARAAKALLRDTAKARGEYAQTLATLDYPQFMAPAELAKDKSFVHAASDLQIVKESVSTRDHALAQAFSNYRGSVTNSKISLASKQNALAKLDAELANTSASRLQKSKLELDMVEKFDAQLQDLKKADGLWKVEAGHFNFSDKKSFDEYNDHLNAVISDEKALIELKAQHY